MLDINVANDYLDSQLSLGIESISKLTDSELALLQEYKELRRQSAKNEILKGFWQTIAKFTGPQPTSGEGAKMVAVKGDLYVFGGFSMEAYGDMRYEAKARFNTCIEFETSLRTNGS